VIDVLKKPWTNEEEKKLRMLVEERKPLNVIAGALGKSQEAVRMKIKRLGINVVEHSETERSSTSDLVLPEELPSVEEALKILCAALDALQHKGLDQAEVFRLRTIIQGCKIYKELLADYVNYRGIEAQIEKMVEEYERLLSEAKNVAPKAAISKVVQGSGSATAA
jgi:hypothetical protein